ncbi:hypothetical protein [Prosthecobacter sp.]
MTATLDPLDSTVRSLTAPDMGLLVSRLLGDLSQGLPDASDAEFDAMADEREAEMDRDPSATISHDEMLRFITEAAPQPPL